jgi:hypothetical protein
MFIGRWLGWLLLFGALIAVVIELFKFVTSGTYAVVALGEIWYNIHANSEVGLQAFVEKSISPALWTNVIVPLLSLPAWLVLGLPGGILLLLFRHRRHRSFGRH